MSIQYRTWLPASAFDLATLDTSLADAIAGWSAKWFAGSAAAEVKGFAPATARGGDRRVLRWSLPGDGLQLIVDPDARWRIAGAMLDHAVDTARMKPADRETVDALAEKCLDDLKLRVTRSFALEGSAEWTAGPANEREEDRFSASLGWNKAAAFGSVLVERSLVVRMLKTRCGPTPAGQALAPFADALETVELRLSAALGQSALSLAEVDALGKGDVIVLDRALDASLPLLLDGRIQARGSCRIGEALDRFQLEIEEPIR